MPYRNRHVIIRREGHEAENLEQAKIWALIHGYPAIIETRRKTAKEDGENGRFYVKGEGMTAQEAVTFLNTQPRSNATGTYYQKFAHIIS